MDASLIIPILSGWIAGLFVNYAADVLPHTRRFSQPACPHCQTPFSWMDYLTLRACRNCGTNRSLRTWLVLFLTIASFTYFWLFPARKLGFFLDIIVLTYFGIVIVIDLEHRLILHPTSLAGAILGLIIGTYINSRVDGLLLGVGRSLLGGLLGFGVMYLVYQLGTLVARFRARKMQAAGQIDDEEEAFGGGDVYLTGVLGLMLGWPLILYGIAFGVLVGGAVSLLALLGTVFSRRYTKDALMMFIPYGPSLIIGALYALFII